MSASVKGHGGRMHDSKWTRNFKAGIHYSPCPQEKSVCNSPNEENHSLIQWLIGCMLSNVAK